MRQGAPAAGAGWVFRSTGGGVVAPPAFLPKEMGGGRGGGGGGGGVGPGATRRGMLPPTAFGQKYWSWRSAAEWKVRAWTPAAPSWRRRPRISPAARLVKVTASTLEGCSIPARTP